VAHLPPGSADLLGACGKPVPCSGRDEGARCYQELFAKYRFYAAFENTRCRGYVTEKFLRGFSEGMVPLAMGGLGRATYDALGVPRSAYVHMDDFGSASELAKFLKDMDDETYGQYFAWRRNYTASTSTGADVFCQVCQELAKPPERQRPSRSFGSSLASWWYDGTCLRYSPRGWGRPA